MKIKRVHPPLSLAASICELARDFRDTFGLPPTVITIPVWRKQEFLDEAIKHNDGYVWGETAHITGMLTPIKFKDQNHIEAE